MLCIDMLLCLCSVLIIHVLYWYASLSFVMYLICLSDNVLYIDMHACLFVLMRIVLFVLSASLPPREPA